LIGINNSNSDIKPDNILLDEQGNAHLTDFNIAVHFNERRMHTGVAGSLAYMAPEILAKRGYTYTIDWWSLGVCAYELILGRRPFRGKSNAELTSSISKEPLKFPEDYSQKCSRAGIHVIKGVSITLVTAWSSWFNEPPSASCSSAGRSNGWAASPTAKVSGNSANYLGSRVSIGINWKPKGYPHRLFLMYVDPSDLEVALSYAAATVVEEA
jgi:serine/threonine protein kinase